MARSGETGRAFEADSELHLEIARRTGNLYLHDALERLDAKVQLLRLAVCVTEETVLADMRQHDAIVGAIATHDAGEAERRMTEHILQHVHGDAR